MASEILKQKIDQWFAVDNRATTLERIQYTFECEDLFAKEPDALAYGKTLGYILSRISTPVDPDLDIVGQMIMSVPTPEQDAEIRAVYHRWWDMPLEERQKLILFYYSEGWLRCRPYWFASMGHLGFDWEAILNQGFDALKAKAEARLTCSCNAKQQEFLQGTMLCYEAFSDYYLRYAQAAEDAGKPELAADLRQVSHGKAATFQQALQHLWLIIMVCQKICGCGVFNLSRMDQYLLPLYRQDIANGTLTPEKALDLVEQFYFRNNEIMMQTDHMSLDTISTSDTLELAFDDPNYVTLGGLNADGTSGVNELSMIMLKAAHNLKLRNPFVVVRYHKDIDRDFWRLTCEAMRDNATVVIYNDETMIPALKYHNVQSPEVYDYGFWGCNDPCIAGYEGGLRQLWMNMAKPLELALHQGDYPMDPRGDKPPRDCEFDIWDRMVGLMTGTYYGLKTKPMEEVESMEDFIDIYRQQFIYLIGEYRKAFEIDMVKEHTYSFGKLRIEDCFLSGTVENAVTWTEGGTKYHKLVAQGCGLATVIDSLFAIDHLVFQTKQYTLPQLAEILRTNYEGHEELALQMKHKLDKFGNDKDAVDQYAKVLTDIFIEAIDTYNGPEYLYQMWPTYSTDRDFTTMGKYVGATPDGRHAMDPLSENQSPCESADLSGLTAMLNSLAKVPYDRITGGPLNVRIHPSAVHGEAGLDVMCALFETFLEQGGMQLQINVVDVETLKAAQKDPEKFRNLCVRVTGYSAFFVEMGEKAQNEMIERTEHLV